MKDNNKILSALLDHLIHSSEDGEADEVDKWDTKDKPAIDDDAGDDDEEREAADDAEESDSEDDEDSKRMKKFLAALRD